MSSFFSVALSHYIFFLTHLWNFSLLSCLKAPEEDHFSWQIVVLNSLHKQAGTYYARSSTNKYWRIFCIFSELAPSAVFAPFLDFQ